MTIKSKDITKCVAVILIALFAVGCEAIEPAMPMEPGPIYPDHGIQLTPKKTITIKRKKPTITNPSPRPLSAGDITEIEEYNDEE